MSIFNFTLKTIIRIGLGAFLILMVVGYLILGANPYFDINTLAISFVTWSFIFYIHQNRWTETSPLPNMVAVIFTFFLLSRLLVYVYLPGQVEFPFEQHISLDDINSGLLYVSVGTLFFLIGLTCASVVMNASKLDVLYSKQSGHKERLLVWIVIFSIVAIFEIYFTQWLSMTAYNGNKLREFYGQSTLQLLRALFGTDTALLACLTYFALPNQWIGDRKQWIWILVLTFIALIIYALSGSRGGPIRLLEFVFAVLLIRGAADKIRVARLISFVFIFLLFGTLSFSIGSYIRTSTANGSKATLFGAFEEVESDLRGYSGQGTLSINKLEQGPSAINRLGAGLDYAIFVTSHAPSIGSECADRFLNYRYFLKSIANYLVPGTVYPEAELNTSRVFSICYREMSFEHVLNVSGYNSELWTMWGLALLMYGWWGGMAFMFACGFALHAFYYLICRTFPSVVVPYFAAAYIFLAPGLLLLNFGLDHVVNTFVAVGVQLTVVLLLFFVVSALIDSVKRSNLYR